MSFGWNQFRIPVNSLPLKGCKERFQLIREVCKRVLLSCPPAPHRPLGEMDLCWLGPQGVLDKQGEKEREVSEGTFPLPSFPGRQALGAPRPGPRCSLASSWLTLFWVPPLGPGGEAWVHTDPWDAPGCLAKLGRRWGPRLLPEPSKPWAEHPQSLGPHSAPRLGCSGSVPHPECPCLLLGHAG